MNRLLVGHGHVNNQKHPCDATSTALPNPSLDTELPQ